MLIRELTVEVETALRERTGYVGYESKNRPLWKWAAKKRGSLFKRLAFLVNKQTFKEWDRAEDCFRPNLTHEFWPIVNQAERYEAAYARLADDESREVLRWRLKARLVMPFVMKWEDVFPPPPIPGVGDLRIGEDAESFCSDFATGQYLLQGICMPEQGDVVLDFGAYLGDSAVIFSRLTGDEGRVHAFEALPGQYEAMRENVKRLGCDNVTPHFNAVWNRNETVMMTEARASSSVGQGTIPVPAVRMDDFVKEQGLDRVDFIKMDIEGAEMEALEGGAETIERFRPKLALSAYHKPEDLYALMEAVSSIHDGYRFYMRHYNAGLCDTVLYAVTD